MSGTPLLNPSTPLAYLPPDIALQLETARYLHVGTFGAFVWDWLMSMGEEYGMIRKSDLKRSFPIVAYFIARLGALGFIISTTLFETAVIHNCTAMEKAISACYIVAMPGACFLFFLRVRAIFYYNRLVQGFFTFLWICVVGSSVVVPFAIKGTHIGPTQYCINSHFQSFGTAAVITSTVNDTLILLAISYKLAWENNRHSSSWREVAKSLLTGEGLGRISKILYRGGLMYYLTTVSLNIVTTVMNQTPSVPPVYRSMVTVPNVALQNAMACRIFRKLRLGLIVEGDSEVHGGGNSSQQSMPLAWRRPHPNNVVVESSGSTLTSKPRPILEDDGYNSSVVDIKATNDVELSMGVWTG